MLDKNKLSSIVKDLGISITFDSQEPGIYIENEKDTTFENFDFFVDIFETKNSIDTLNNLLVRFDSQERTRKIKYKEEILIEKNHYIENSVFKFKEFDFLVKEKLSYGQKDSMNYVQNSEYLLKKDISLNSTVSNNNFNELEVKAA